MQLVLATNNRDKITEIKHLLDDLPVTILTADDFLDFPDPNETGTTLVENAILKAKEIAEFTGLSALADDSGLEVDALNGAPGVYSSRYAGENVTYRDNYEKLIRELHGIEPERRTARFRCVIAIVWSEGEIETVEGAAEGIITEDVVGDKGFGYDPVFYCPPLKKRFSEMTLDEKNQVSHRGKALQKARDVIIERLNKSTKSGFPPTRE
jgi:XTP/dITP diphosphohydrolase